MKQKNESAEIQLEGTKVLRAAGGMFLQPAWRQVRRALVNLSREGVSQAQQGLAADGNTNQRGTVWLGTAQSAIRWEKVFQSLRLRVLSMAGSFIFTVFHSFFKEELNFHPVHSGPFLVKTTHYKFNLKEARIHKQQEETERRRSRTHSFYICTPKWKYMPEWTMELLIDTAGGEAAHRFFVSEAPGKKRKSRSLKGEKPPLNRWGTEET